MARNIAGIGTSIVVILGTLLGLSTAASAVQKKKPIKVTLPPKSCTWVQSGTVVPSGSYTRDSQDGSLWKCTNGTWTSASSKGRSNRGSKGGSSKGGSPQ
jgi:hypothetical protein